MQDTGNVLPARLSRLAALGRCFTKAKWSSKTGSCSCFTERNRTYVQTANEASLPQEGFEDRSLSTRTINRWFRFFRMLCRQDFRKNKDKIGGEGTIIEGDESLFGKIKYGRGAKKNRGEPGLICRTTRRLFLYACPSQGIVKANIDGRDEHSYQWFWPTSSPGLCCTLMDGWLIGGWTSRGMIRNTNGSTMTCTTVIPRPQHKYQYCWRVQVGPGGSRWAQVKRWLPKGGTGLFSSKYWNTFHMFPNVHKIPRSPNYIQTSLMLQLPEPRDPRQGWWGWWQPLLLIFFASIFWTSARGRVLLMATFLVTLFLTMIQTSEDFDFKYAKSLLISIIKKIRLHDLSLWEQSQIWQCFIINWGPIDPSLCQIKSFPIICFSQLSLYHTCY